jgi:tetratricopeptide (TPR) repeat protein
MQVFDGLYLFEVVMLFLGAVLFLVLVIGLVVRLLKGGNLKGLLAFFVLSVVMMGYPSIKSIQVQKDGVSLDKATRELQADPTNAQLRNDLEKQVSNVSHRPVSDPATLTRLAKAEFILGNEKGAEQDVKKALQADPNTPDARQLQNRITAFHTLDSATSEAEKHPGDPAAKAQLQQAVTQASQQPVASPVALTKIANAQTILGQHEKATENVNKALQINPNLAEAKKVQTSIIMHQTH